MRPSGPCGPARHAVRRRLRASPEVERLLADDERASRDRFLTDPSPPGQGDEGSPARAPRRRGLDIHILCPHCRNPIELVGLTADDVVCPACGSTFRLERESTASWGSRGDQRRLGRFELIEASGSGPSAPSTRPATPSLTGSWQSRFPARAAWPRNEDRDRFLREARSAAQLRHPGIVPVHEVGEHEGLPYIVSDFVGGLTLADIVTGRRPAPREAAGLVAEVADALEYAHGRGVIHRDIKPSNIMIDDAGRPHVMDFGLAKREAGEVTMTMDGQVLGTPAYMSPEQATGRRPQGRWPQRHLQPGGDALRAAHGRAAVPGQPADAAAPGAPRRAPAAAEPERPGPARPGDDLPQGDGQGAESAVRDGTGSGRRPAALPAGRADPGAAGGADGEGLALVPAQSVAGGGQSWPRGVGGRGRALAGLRRGTNEGEEPDQSLAKDLQSSLNKSESLAGELKTSLKESERRLAALNFERGHAACEKGEMGPGLLRLAESWLGRSGR